LDSPISGPASVIRSPVLLLAALFFLVGCAPDLPPEISSGPSIKANPNEAAPLAALLSFETSEPVKTEITVEAGERSHSLTYPDTLDPSDGLPVVGLWPGVENRIHVTVEDRGMNRVTLEKTLTYRPPSLPKDRTVFPPIQVTAADTARMEPGFTLFNARRLGFQGTSGRSFDQNFGLLIILDRSAEPVWYYRTDSRISDFNVLPNGHLLYLTQDYRAVEIDLLGNKVASWYAAGRPQGKAEGTPVETITFHHDIERLHSGNLLVLGSEQRQIDDYYSSETDPNAPRSTQTVMGDRVLEFDPATGETIAEAVHVAMRMPATNIRSASPTRTAARSSLSDTCAGRKRAIKDPSNCGVDTTSANPVANPATAWPTPDWTVSGSSSRCTQSWSRLPGRSGRCCRWSWTTSDRRRTSS
jgi:hypothetical protein